MKRQHNNLTNLEIKQSLDFLRLNNCIDYKSLLQQTEAIEDILLAVKQVNIINPKFLMKPWNIYDLEKEKASEHFGLLQFMKKFGCADVTKDTTTQELIEISTTFDYYFRRGFDSSPWDTTMLYKFASKYDEVLEKLKKYKFYLKENEVIPFKDLQTLETRYIYICKFEDWLENIHINDPWCLEDLVSAESNLFGC